MATKILSRPFPRNLPRTNPAPTGGLERQSKDWGALPYQALSLALARSMKQLVW